ncbi:MAG: AmmeMemoRadiSam system protein A [Atopobiaceae bacterium]|nr:AmmeMemoRadiSam system protein A [Atopobiaceae bacterium]
MAICGAFVLPHPPLIIPQVGRGRERDIQATVDACEQVGRQIAELAPNTIVITSPHATLYRDYFHISPGSHARGSFAQYGAPRAAYEVTYDAEFASRLSELCARAGIEAGTDYERDARLDHGTMIAIHFVQKYLSSFEVVRIGLSGFSPAEHYRLGQAIQQTARELDRRVVHVASGDLSHKLLAEGPYGFAPEGPEFDERIAHDLATGDLVDILAIDPSLAERAAECGLRSFQIMVGVFHKTPVRTELLSHEGPFGVGYGVATVMPTGAEGTDENCDRLAAYEELRMQNLMAQRAQEDPYVRLARASLERYVRDGIRMGVPSGLPEELLNTRAGCFVSLKKDGALRGCIGTIAPTRSSLAEEICANAISAGTRDPRFMRVREHELGDLVYDVDVLGKPEYIDSMDQLDPVRYGVIVSCADGRRGLLLPDLDGVDTAEEQVRIAAQKGRIDLDFDYYRLERFEVVRHL